MRGLQDSVILVVSSCDPDHIRSQAEGSIAYGSVCSPQLLCCAQWRTSRSDNCIRLSSFENGDIPNGTLPTKDDRDSGGRFRLGSGNARTSRLILRNDEDRVQGFRIWIYMSFQCERRCTGRIAVGEPHWARFSLPKFSEGLKSKNTNTQIWEMRSGWKVWSEQL